MKHLYILPLFLMTLSCVNTPDENDGDLICHGSKEIDVLEVNFEFTGTNPVRPLLKIDNEEVDYCYSGDYRKFCLYDITTSFGKLNYRIATFDKLLDPQIILLDDTTSRLERTDEEVTQRPARPGEACANSVIFSVLIKE